MKGNLLTMWRDTKAAIQEFPRSERTKKVKRVVSNYQHDTGEQISFISNLCNYGEGKASI